MSNIDLFLLEIIGGKGIVLFVGILIFITSYRNSQHLFLWFENQTLGTKNYVEMKLELLQKRIKSEHITYGLFGLVFIPSTLAFGILALLGFIEWGLILFPILMLIGLKSPRPFMDYLVQKRVEKYESQMVDGLNLLANGIRAGLSVPQSIAMVVDEMPAPLSEEFNLILQQNKIGSPLENCFEDFAKRMPTEDNLMFVTAVNILRETGGNLAEVFDTIIEVIRERIRLSQKIKTYTSQAKAQAILIFSMPFALLIIGMMTQPETTKIFFTNPLGIMAFLLAMFLTFLGGFIIRKILQIKV